VTFASTVSLDTVVQTAAIPKCSWKHNLQARNFGEHQCLCRVEYKRCITEM